MILLESLRIAFGQVWAHKLRSILTLLGILIGVGSVVGIVSISEGMRRMVVGEFGKMFGDRILEVRPREWMLRDGRWVQNHRYRPMAMEDVALVRGVSDRIEAVLPMLSSSAQMRYAKATWNGQLEATVPAYAEAYDWRAGEGRFLLPRDVSAARSVCVLGMQAKEALFGRAPAVGREVKLNGDRYAVAGVMEERTLFGQEWSSIVFVPATTAMQRLLGTRQISGVVAVAATAEEVPRLGAAIVAALQEKYGPRMEYEIDSPANLISQIEQTILVMKL
ncbi:MAG: ABC transporter permease, partial [Gemmatimonadetes bacterium]|nr:ABC transporter permease [Gemmatimonadota bacterium]